MRGEDILKLKMSENSAGATTIGEYLQKLLFELWTEGERFSGKRPFGDSDWEYELFYPLCDAGLVSYRLGGDGEYCDIDSKYGSSLIFSAIDALMSD